MTAKSERKKSFKFKKTFSDGHYGCQSLVKVLTISVDREKGFFFFPLFIFLVLMSYSRYMHRKEEN